MKSRLKAILRSPEHDAVTRSWELVRDEDKDLDRELFWSLQNELTFFKVRALACRILIERDRDRWPEQILHLVPGGNIMADRDRSTRPSRPPVVNQYEFGFSRLRRLDPIGQYDTILSAGYPYTARCNAAIGLGDTGESDALDPLLKALEDSDILVRDYGADAIRRLSNAGLRAVILQHPVRERLIGLLREPASLRKTRIASARALASLGELEPVKEHLSRSIRDRREWQGILDGKIPPLKKTWPGDVTI